MLKKESLVIFRENQQEFSRKSFYSRFLETKNRIRRVLTTITKAIIESGLDETKIVRTDVVFRFSSNTKYFASKTTQHFAKLPPPCPKLPMASHV